MSSVRGTTRSASSDMGSPKKAAAQVASLRAKALAPSELSSEEIWTSYGLAFVAAALGPGGGVFRLGLGVGVVLADENGGAKLDHRAANRSCFWAE